MLELGLGLMEDCSVEGVEEEGVVEEEVGVVAMLEAGEFDAFEDAGVIDEKVEEDGFWFPEEEDGVSPSWCMEPMSWEPMFWGTSRRPRLPLPMPLPALRSGRPRPCDAAEPLSRVRRVVARRFLRCMVVVFLEEPVWVSLWLSVWMGVGGWWLWLLLYSRARGWVVILDPLRGQGYIQ